MRTGVACLTAVLLAGLALHTGLAQSGREVSRAEYDRAVEAGVGIEKKMIST